MSPRRTARARPRPGRRSTAAMVAVTSAACVGLLAGRAQAVTAAPLEGIPAFRHVVVLTEENESASTTFAPNSPATYLNGLLAKAVFLPNYYGTGHASLDNYISMVSGQEGNATTNGDCLGISLYACVQAAQAPSTTPGRHLGDQLDAAGVTWAGYADGGTPAAPTGDCFHSPYSAASPGPDLYQGASQTPPAYDYADRHVPFLYFDDVVGNPARCAAHQHGTVSLPAALAGDTLPGFSFITPDTCHDGHDATCSNGSPGGLVSADAWLKDNLPPLLDYLAAHDGLLVINFDEGGVGGTDTCTTCAGKGAGGRTGALLISPRLAAGTTDTTGYDHFSLLRTIEDSFGITEKLNMASLANPMTAAFTAATPPADLPESSTPLLLVLPAGATAAWLLTRRRRHTRLMPAAS